MEVLERTSSTATILVLSLFPGIGLLDMAFEEEGFCVVRGPDPLWGGDVRLFHAPAGRSTGSSAGRRASRSASSSTWSGRTATSRSTRT
jgi:hypothetical protein